jgi:hypothetical protein
MPNQIILTKHSGLTQVSPVDKRYFNILSLSSEDRLLAIFGQDSNGKPVKLTMYFESMNRKNEVEKILKILFQQS